MRIPKLTSSTRPHSSETFPVVSRKRRAESELPRLKKKQKREEESPWIPQEVLTFLFLNANGQGPFGDVCKSWNACVKKIIPEDFFKELSKGLGSNYSPVCKKMLPNNLTYPPSKLQIFLPLLFKQQKKIEQIFNNPEKIKAFYQYISSLPPPENTLESELNNSFLAESDYFEEKIENDSLPYISGEDRCRSTQIDDFSEERAETLSQDDISDFSEEEIKNDSLPCTSGEDRYRSTQIDDFSEERVETLSQDDISDFSEEEIENDLFSYIFRKHDYQDQNTSFSSTDVNDIEEEGSTQIYDFSEEENTQIYDFSEDRTETTSQDGIDDFSEEENTQIYDFSEDRTETASQDDIDDFSREKIERCSSTHIDTEPSKSQFTCSCLKCTRKKKKEKMIPSFYCLSPPEKWAQDFVAIHKWIRDYNLALFYLAPELRSRLAANALFDVVNNNFSISEKVKKLRSLINISNQEILNFLNYGLTEIPQEILFFTHLKELYLSENHLYEIGPVSSLPSLNLLDLSCNDFKSLPSLPPLLEKLDISHNNFKEIPLSILKLSNLEILNISRNRLKEIPSEIFNLSNLNNLNISFNNFQNLPALPPQLVVLNISHNPFKEIPASIFELSNLKTLDISGIPITELLPSELFKLSSLEILTISPGQAEFIPKDTGNITIKENPSDISTNGYNSGYYEMDEFVVESD